MHTVQPVTSKSSEVVRCQSVPSAAESCMVYFCESISSRRGTTHSGQTDNIAEHIIATKLLAHTHTPCLTRLPRPEIALWGTQSSCSDGNRCPRCCAVLNLLSGATAIPGRCCWRLGRMLSDVRSFVCCVGVSCCACGACFARAVCCTCVVVFFLSFQAAAVVTLVCCSEQSI